MASVTQPYSPPLPAKKKFRHRLVLEEVIDFLEMQAIRKKIVGSLPYGLMKRVELAEPCPRTQTPRSR